MEKYFRLIIVIVLGLIVISFLGFKKTYFGLFPHFEGTTWIVHFHVFTILCWFAMLIAQASLAKSGRIGIHRKIGRLSYLLAPLIVIGFALIANQAQLKHKAPDLFGATLFDASLFILFYSLAIINRKNTAFHARYMILSALPFINPSLGRFISPAVSLPVEFLIILTLLLTAYFNKRPYRPYLVAMGSLVLLLGIIIYISMIKPAIIESVWLAIWG
ncbi:MAG: hypothetical protein JNK77_02130 [Saprospiraceae bacterium]|nr:hypothetical protein [Saprospiraceae bacterium]